MALASGRDSLNTDCVPAESSAGHLASPFADLCSNSSNSYVFVKLEWDDDVRETP